MHEQLQLSAISTAWMVGVVSMRRVSCTARWVA